jgi:outer membrane lipoprotein-sorting protein
MTPGFFLSSRRQSSTIECSFAVPFLTNLRKVAAMRTFICGLSGVVLLLALESSGRGGGEDHAKEVVAKAIKAAGGEAKVAALKAGTGKLKATVQDGNMEISAAIDAAWQGIDQYRFTIAADFGGMTKNMVVVVNGDKGWAKDVDRNMTREAPKEAPGLVTATLYAMRMPHLLTTLLDKEVKLSALGEVQVEGRAALGVTVAHKDRKDVRLFFDKENGLPVKSEIRLTEPSGKEVDFEFRYEAYKEQEGLKHPTRIHVKGADKVNVVVEVSSLMPQEKVEASMFAAPE